MSNKEIKVGRPTVLTVEMTNKIIELYKRYGDNISKRKIGRILQEDFGLEKPVHHYVISRFLNSRKRFDNARSGKRYYFEEHSSEKKIYQNIDLLKEIKIELIDVDDLLDLFSKKELKSIENLKWVICGDFQIPFHDEHCVKELYKFIEDYQPHLVIFNGDVVDLYCMSRFDKNPKRKSENTLYSEIKIEAEIYNKINKLSPETKIIKKIRGGNHETRYYKYMYKRSPAVAEFTYLEKILHNVAYSENLPIKVFISERVNDYLADFCIKHEGYLTKTGIYRNIENTSFSVAVNHSHRLGIITSKMQHDGKIKYSIECGCMCHDPQGYQPDVGIVRGFAYGKYNIKTSMLHPQIMVLEDKV